MENNPFRSFWMGGYECADILNAFGNRVNLQRLSGHKDRLVADYRDLTHFGIRTVREGICWSAVERRAYRYDWTTVTAMIHTGRQMGVQQVWDMCHFGFPDDLSPLHPMFARRFAALCRAFVQHYRSNEPDGPLIVVPINEVSFISWLGGDVRGTVPYCVGQGWEVKYALMRAYIEGIYAMREVDPGVRLLTTEPLINRVPCGDATPEQMEQAAFEHALQYQAVDMLCGVICPELGGNRSLLDIMGVNYYHNNQLIAGTDDCLPWVNTACDPRWRSMSDLMLEAWLRYDCPLLLAETSHPGIDRPDWIRYVGKEAAVALQHGLPLWGICLYPVIDRPDWNEMENWHRSGLWDAVAGEDGSVGRELVEPYAIALQEVMEQVENAVLLAPIAD
ncbi:amine oxidase [Flavihumibacter petaseus]|uniref:Amine oxidase n=1 Tax=Flavihumibacter petaseus NBRC 106054 TaxID=1220578 RepID=A0A0E9N2K8_9BACT|nr:amine oxidase [Flavihumibacter petaseus]GAO44033.1 hypothetical protein FPE01S_03_00730 [Flavihumibacter petaseus NBRC 106054]